MSECTNVTRYMSEYYKGYRVRIEIPQFNFTESTDIVTMIKADLASTDHVNVMTTASVIGSLFSRTYTEEVDDNDYDDNWEYSSPASISVDPQVWETVIGSGFTVDRYLRVDFLLNKEIPLQERIDYLTSLIDSDYRKKSSNAGFFGTILAIGVFVIAIVLAAPTGGWSLTIVKGGTALLLAVAYAVSVAALVLALTTAALYQAGAIELAGSFTSFMKMVEPLVMIATIVNLVNIVTNTVKGLANEGANAASEEIVKEQLKSAGVDLAAELADEMGKALFDAMVDEVAMDLVSEQFTSMVWAGVKDKFANLLSSKITDITFEQGIKIANYVFEQVQKNETAQIKDQIADERSKLEALQKEEVQVNDLLVDINRGLYAPLAKDQSMYAATYDKPYEWWSTRYHTGCCQYNGVSAMWLADKAK